MKIKTLFLGCIAAFALTIARGQTEYFGMLNPCSFKYTIIDSIPTVKWIRVPVRVYDNVNKRYIFSGSTDEEHWKLYSINASDGSVISCPAFPVIKKAGDNVINWQYANSLNKLLALHWDNDKQTEYLVSIDTKTGAHTIINSLPGVNWIEGVGMMDNTNNRYIFKGADKDFNWFLYSVDAISGAIVSSPALDFTNGIVSNHVYSNTLNKLFALRKDKSSNQWIFVEVSPSTGEYTDRISIPDMEWIEEMYTDFDDYHKRYIFKGGDSNGKGYLYSIDAVNGTIFCDPVFPKFPLLDNIIMPRTDSQTGVTYALHWESVTVHTKKEVSPPIGFFPNPLKNHANVSLGRVYKNITIFIYNTAGQLVRKQTASDVNAVVISRENLPTGEYFISVIGDDIHLETFKASVQ